MRLHIGNILKIWINKSFSFSIGITQEKKKRSENDGNCNLWISMNSLKYVTEKINSQKNDIESKINVPIKK